MRSPKSPLPPAASLVAVHRVHTEAGSLKLGECREVEEDSDEEYIQDFIDNLAGHGQGNTPAEVLPLAVSQSEAFYSSAPWERRQRQL